MIPGHLTEAQFFTEPTATARRSRPSALAGSCHSACFGLLLFAGLASAALAQTPPFGRYRCYQPPAYTVTAWFDLDAAGYRLNGGSAQPYQIDRESGKLTWSGNGIDGRGHGRYSPPGTNSDDGARHTIVLSTTPAPLPTQRDWARLPRCYMTTH
jgi:hypothetical protein